MKKFLSSLFLSVLVVGFIYWFAISMYKSSNEKINRMYMEVKIMDNGDVSIKKALLFNDKDNDINIINKNYKNKFDANDIESYRSSKIYNYGDLKSVQISKIDEFGTDINDIAKKKLSYKKQKDNYKVDSDKIYISYVLTNYAVKHNDIGELLFSITEEEKVDELEVIIELPNKSSRLEYYTHGASNINIENIDNTIVKITGENIDKRDYLDVRLVFDKELIKNSSKLTNVDALSNINAIEKVIENEYIEEEKINNYKGVLGIALDVIKTIWLAVTIFMLMRTYLKYDREYKKKFKKHLLEEKPDEIEPYEVEFLYYTDVTVNSVKSAILKMIKEEKLELKRHEDSYLLKRTKKELTEDEEYLVNLFFKSGLIDIKNLKIKDYESFSELTYEKLIKKYISNSINKKYYEDETSVKKKLVLYSLIGIVLNIISYLVIYNEMIMISIYLVSITTMIYFLAFRKKTKKGNEEYAKWGAYKNYLSTNEINDKNYMDAIIYGNVLGIENKILHNCNIDNDFVIFSKILLKMNILRK